MLFSAPAQASDARERSDPRQLVIYDCLETIHHTLIARLLRQAGGPEFASRFLGRPLVVIHAHAHTDDTAAVYASVAGVCFKRPNDS
jgi:hypothetical protein